MKIGKPIKELPASAANKYRELWNAVHNAHGDWVPISGDSAELERVHSAALRFCECRKTGGVLYLRWKIKER